MVKIACIQMRSGIDVSANLIALNELVGKAVEKGAQYIQTPEMTSLVQKGKTELFATIDRDDGKSAENSTIKFCAELAKRHRVWLHVGSIAIAQSATKAANRGLLFSPSGERVAQYDKIHMFDVDLPNGESWRESSIYQAGSISKVADIGFCKLGMSICYDLRFPYLYRQQAKVGAQVITCPAAFTHQTGIAHWHTLLRARAIENGAFMIAAAQGGHHEDGRHTYGHSLIVNPWGEIIGELEHDKPGILVCEIDLDEVKEARLRIPNLMSSAQFALSELKYEPGN